MYPDRELTRLAARKSWLRRDIALRRVQLAETAAQVSWPLAWLDRMLAVGRRLSPLALLAALPLGCLVTRTVLASMRIFGPLVSGLVRGTRWVGRILARPSPPPERSRTRNVG